MRRGWVDFLATLPEGFVESAERHGLAALVADVPGAPPDLVALAQAVRDVTDLRCATGAGAGLVDGRRASQRKRVQVAAFAELVASLPRRPARIVDVGSGHGHLTRHLARTAGIPAEGRERDPARVAVAARLSTEGDVRFVVEDVRADPRCLRPDDLVVGLHACGELGDLAVWAAREAGASVVLVACCLQKRPGDRPPLVVPAGLTAEVLTLPRAVLGLANTRTGDTGVEADLATRLRARRHRFALGRALRAAGLRVPPGEELRGVNRRRANDDFAALAARVFATRGLALPARAVLEEIERTSVEEFDRERRWALPRAMLGRAMEVWMALDRAALLAEVGRETEVLLAFDDSASPRNVAVVSPSA